MLHLQHVVAHYLVTYHKGMLLVFQGRTPLRMAAAVHSTPAPDAVIQLLLKYCASCDINVQDFKVIQLNCICFTKPHCYTATATVMLMTIPSSFEPLVSTGSDA